MLQVVKTVLLNLASVRIIIHTSQTQRRFTAGTTRPCTIASCLSPTTFGTCLLQAAVALQEGRGPFLTRQAFQDWSVDFTVDPPCQHLLIVLSLGYPTLPTSGLPVADGGLASIKKLVEMPCGSDIAVILAYRAGNVLRLRYQEITPDREYHCYLPIVRGDQQ